MSRDKLRQVRGSVPHLGPVSRLWPRASRPTDPGPGGPARVTEGVPLVKLIKRSIHPDPALVMLGHGHSMAAEKIRRLKTILANAENGGPQVIVVTSPGPEEGKSLVSINLALAFAADTRGDVLLLDGDLRRPTIEHWISPKPRLGLSELLTEQTELEHTVLALENAPLRILPAGAPPDDPIKLLGSDRTRELIDELRKRFRRIIIDTPPSVPFADADAVAAFSDGVLLVARAGSTRRTSFVQAMESLTSAPVLGTVLNDLTYNLADHGSYHGYEKSFYDYYQREREPKTTAPQKNGRPR